MLRDQSLNLPAGIRAADCSSVNELLPFLDHGAKTMINPTRSIMPALATLMALIASGVGRKNAIGTMVSAIMRYYAPY